MKRVTMLLPLLLLAGCVTAKYTDNEGRQVVVKTFLRKSAATDLKANIGPASLSIGGLQGTGDVEMLRELRGLMNDAVAAGAAGAMKTAVPRP